MNDESHPDRGRGRMRRWPLFLVALPAMVSVWSGWVALGQMTGFGTVHPLPGILPRVAIPLAVTLPVGVEAYAAYALAVWLGPWAVTAAARRFAMWSSVASLVLGGSGQVSYHLLAAEHATLAPGFVTVVVSCVPVVVIGCAAALTHLLRDAPGDSETGRVSLAAPLVAALAARIAPSAPLESPAGRAVGSATEDDTGGDTTAAARLPRPRQDERQVRRQARARKEPAWHAVARRAVARNPAVTADELKAKCGVSLRSAQRYLQDHPPTLHAVDAST